MATDGVAFNCTFRMSLFRRRDGQWKFVHEHSSFPCNMATRAADFTSGLKVSDKFSMEKS